MFDAAKKLLKAEWEAIKMLSDRLDDNFEKAVEILLSHTNKTIVCGMGKSGHIARKIAATFSSIGQPSIFLHPAEGAHGDLGVYSNGDPTVIISKSGCTDEIVCLLPILKKFHSKIISIVGNIDGPIARASDAVIDISFAKESDPLQMVPTTSSTVSLAVGDALAAELMSRRSFTKQNFSVFHPAGQLGRNLLLHVSDIMSKISSCATIPPTATLRDVAIAMTEYPLGAAIVVDKNGVMLGIITEGDMRRAFQRNVQLDTTFAKDVMTKNPKFVSPDDTVETAVKIMENRESQISVLPIVEIVGVETGNQKNEKQEKVAVGILRLHDTFKH